MDVMSRRIRDCREALGLSQEDLALRMVGPDQTLEGMVRNIRRWENAEVEPSMRQLRKLAAALGTTPGVLVDGEDETLEFIKESSSELVNPSQIAEPQLRDLRDQLHKMVDLAIAEALETNADAYRLEDVEQ